VDVGQKLRLARIQAEMTLRETEEETGLSKDTISRIERGIRSPQPLTVAKLAKAYGRSAEEFFPKAEAPAPNPSHEAKVKDMMERPSFWTAKEKIEAGQIPIFSDIIPDALGSYIEHRVKLYEEELDNPKSPHFRDANAAALWAESLHQEAGMLTRLVIQQASPLFKTLSAEEKGWAGLKLLEQLVAFSSMFASIRERADERVEAAAGRPTELHQRRLKKAQRIAQESEHRLMELPEAASG
jgi:transcriptional regulator with XRE-family HTH domain